MGNNNQKRRDIWVFSNIDMHVLCLLIELDTLCVM